MLIRYSKALRVNGLNASQFSSLFKGTYVNKVLYKSSPIVRGWTNKIFNCFSTRQIDYSIRATNAASKKLAILIVVINREKNVRQHNRISFF